MTAAITDFTQYAGLRQAADGRDPEVLREVAGQFEALFLQSMLKSMRDASLGDPLFGDSDQHEMYRDMLDQQLAAELAGGKGIGLADMIVRQLGARNPSAAATGSASVGDRHSRGDDAANSTDVEPRWFPVPDRAAVAGGLLPMLPGTGGPVGDARAVGSAAVAPPAEPTIPATGPAEGTGIEHSGAGQGWADPASFARDVWPHAQRVASRLNVAPEAVMAQAALETGWGRHVMPRTDGAISNNLFGIKANAGWQGDSVARRTLEFEAGVPRQEVARFRIYDDVADSFDDYAAFLSDNPRYRSVLGNGSDVEGFARAIADSGYATDPDYAEKISRVANGDLMHEVLGPLKNAPEPSIRN